MALAGALLWTDCIGTLASTCSPRSPCTARSPSAANLRAELCPTRTTQLARPTPVPPHHADGAGARSGPSGLQDGRDPAAVDGEDGPMDEGCLVTGQVHHRRGDLLRRARAPDRRRLRQAVLTLGPFLRSI